MFLSIQYYLRWVFPNHQTKTLSRIGYILFNDHNYRFSKIPLLISLYIEVSSVSTSSIPFIKSLTEIS